MAKNKLNPKLITGIILSVVLFSFIFFAPLAIFYPDSQGSLDDALQRANEDLNAVEGLEIEFCNSIEECPDALVIENRTIFENIINPPEGIVIPPQNDTITIDDSSFKIIEGTDVIEEVPEPIPTPEPVSMEIISSVIKIDNTGKRTESTTTTQIPQLAFFVEDTSNIDFDNGLLEQALIIKSSPQIEVTASAKFDVLIAEKSIFTEQVPISIKGTTDSNGELILQFKPLPTVSSEQYLYKFKDHITKFELNGVTPVRFVLSEITIDANNQKFSLTNSTVFSMDIARDQNQLLVKDDSGAIIRVYPKDDRLLFYASLGGYKVYTCVDGRAYTCYRMGYVSVSTPTVPLGGGKVTHFKQDGTSEVIFTFPATLASSVAQTKINILLQRDEVYQINFDSPVGVVKFKTPVTKKDYTFSCTGTTPTVCNYKDITVINALTASLGQ